MSLVDQQHCAGCTCISRRGRAPVGYLGWSERGNMGDDAIRQAIERALPDAQLHPLALTVRDLSRLAIPRIRTRLQSGHVLLGGGTAVGRRNWRLPLQAQASLTSRRPLLMIGAGVEDPTFQGRHSFSGGAELRKWLPLLRQFDRVTVRGPRSARLLADLGVESAVVGDPALLLEAPDLGLEPGLIGVNLGYGSDLWSHSQLNVLKEVAPAIRKMERSGWRFRFLVVNLEDAQWTRFCIALAQLPPGSYDVMTTTRPDTYLSAVAPCELLLGQRLHAVILAACAGVPSLMLEYQPKCRDFMESIGSGERSFRTDRVRALELHEALEAAARNRSELAVDVASRVRELRLRLRTEVQHLSEVLDTPVRT
jgi:polysaccharide pyruvyl transferase WcaK-like protein